LCALIFQRGYNYIGVVNKKAEDITQGTVSLLIKDGVLNLKELRKARLAKQQLYAMLREKNIYNLSKITRAYFESCGMLSVFETEEEKPGLPIMPQCDKHIIDDILQQVDHGLMACCNCGHVQQIPNENTPCEVCHEHTWSGAYVVNEK